MARTRLRTKLVLLSLIFTTALLGGASLLIVHIYRKDAKAGIDQQISNSLETFKQYMQQRQQLHSQAAAVAADLPVIQAAMTTHHEQTIQITSGDIWRRTQSDLFLLADPDGKVMALHSSIGDFDREVARKSLGETVRQRQTHGWWFEGGRLFEVFLQPIYLGDRENDSFLGMLVTGSVVDEKFAATVARLTSGEVAFRYGSAVVTSSLPADKEQELSTSESLVAVNSPMEIRLGGENFVAASKVMDPEGTQPVTFIVLKSYDAATQFLQNMNRLLLAVGLVALVAGSLVMFLISYTLTRPLSKLTSGVVALEKGDFSYPLHLGRRDEVGELINAFDTMRKSLKESQRHLLHAERLATIGRMASTISHDLRHPLTTIIAYAELLSDSNVDDEQRMEMYGQIRSSVNNMAELIASLLEFSKAQEALQLTFGDCVETLQDTIRDVKMKPEFDGIQMTLVHDGPTEGWFDFAKLARVFSNLLKNACEAVTPDSGRVRVVAHGSNSHVEISVSDNGSGIPDTIRDEIFHPFVTFGKADGTGLGLAVVEKIVVDHGGKIAVESTGPHGTTFKLTLPVAVAARVR